MTTTGTPIRVRRPPALDGPYDDERTDAVPMVTGSLALALPGLAAPPPVPLRLVPPACAVDGGGEPPPPRLICSRLAQALAEVLAGSRAPGQLAEFTSYDVLCQLERSAGRLANRTGPTLAPRVTSLHVSEPTPRVAEACLVIDTGRRRRAVALRLEAPGNRWRCVALQLG